jgi:hypothetical protein
MIFGNINKKVLIKQKETFLSQPLASHHQKKKKIKTKQRGKKTWRWLCSHPLVFFH